MISCLKDISRSIDVFSLLVFWWDYCTELNHLKQNIYILINVETHLNHTTGKHNSVQRKIIINVSDSEVKYIWNDMMLFHITFCCWKWFWRWLATARKKYNFVSTRISFQKFTQKFVTGAKYPSVVFEDLVKLCRSLGISEKVLKTSWVKHL